jgi:hypothetical protein
MPTRCSRSLGQGGIAVTGESYMPTGKFAANYFAPRHICSGLLVPLAELKKSKMPLSVAKRHWPDCYEVPAVALGPQFATPCASVARRVTRYHLSKLGGCLDNSFMPQE